MDLSEQECGQLPFVSLTNMRKEYFASIGQKPKFTKTLDCYSPTPLQKRLMSLQGVSHVKIYQQLEKKQELRKAKEVVFGEKCLESFARLDLNSQSWKTYQACLLESGELGWESFSQTWPLSGMMHNGIVYLLPILGGGMKGNEFGLLPTPTKSDGMCLKRFTIASQFKSEIAGRQERPHAYLLLLSRFKFPRFCQIIEYLMGYPMRWTELRD